MSHSGDQPDKMKALRSLNLTLAVVTGQVGCLTILIIIAALFIGRWLDTRFESSPLFTIVLMIGSVPVTLVLMFWVVRSVTARFASSNKAKSQAERGAKSQDQEEDSEGGTTST
jgi:formate hydrogenlyase subunit 4